ncbi:MAG: hypothetical protein ACI8Z1_001793 [Candidatus Azotimanducaceae bacterium]|jgi:hypothetical protein
MKPRNRIFYSKDPDAVVINKDGREVASYKTTEEMIETHIKGILAKDHQDTEKVRELILKYRPTDVLRR